MFTRLELAKFIANQFSVENFHEVILRNMNEKQLICAFEKACGRSIFKISTDRYHLL